MGIFNQTSIKLSKGFKDGEENKPDQATMRPGCFSACINHVTYVCSDKWTNRRMRRLKTCWLIICFSVGSHRDQKQPKNLFFAQALRTDRQTDRRTDGQTLL